MPKISKKIPITVYVIAAILVLYFVIPRLSGSLNTFSEGTGSLRFEQIQESVTLVVANPIFGVGSGMSLLQEISNNPYGIASTVALPVHNWYLLITSEHGIPILFIFVIYLCLSFKKNISQIINNPVIKEIDFFRIGSLSGVLALLIVGIFQPFVGLNLIFIVFGILESPKNEKLV